MGADSVVDLLFLLGTEQDEHTSARVTVMLTWLQEIATDALEPNPGSSRGTQTWAKEIPASAACIHSVAAVLWRLHSCGAACDLSMLLSSQLFTDIYQWTLCLPAKSGVKAALDAVLCSMCYIQPELFPALLRTIGSVSPTITINASVSDDAKDMEHDQTGPMTDDRKQLEAWSRNISLSEGQLMTIAMVSQSPPAVKHLLESDLLSFLSSCVLEFCFHQQELERNPFKNDGSSATLTDADKSALADNSLLSGKSLVVKV